MSSAFFLRGGGPDIVLLLCRILCSSSGLLFLRLFACCSTNVVISYLLFQCTSSNVNVM